jgi:dephospho-CoA kinase
MIIGLTGFARSGKDSVAKVLIENYKFTRVAFADPIRDLLFELNPLLENGHRLSSTVEEYGWEVAKAKPEVRRLMQTLGVSARKIIDEDLWVIKALRTMDDDKNYVVTDIRFENELAVLKLSGAQIWRVKRSGVGAINNHVSEAQMSTFEVDQTFINDGTLADLEATVKSFMVDLLV